MPREPRQVPHLTEASGLVKLTKRASLGLSFQSVHRPPVHSHKTARGSEEVFNKRGRVESEGESQEFKQQSSANQTFKPRLEVINSVLSVLINAQTPPSGSRFSLNIGFGTFPL